ncbi:malectin domain-containing carbohydrate-binding protein [Myxosarcina sp. GI1]|uniref:malectin domain-containing carbohydrate-binding protein n=1 Tax=Myxosarcina sp. GI1 TaxID=1541065 RepID=UPI000567A7E4|nr:malectin domain-containing carbohydrate-binding protein [Myxosarcina sp. GI1]
MVLTTNFAQATLAGLNVNNPTSLQFGGDGRLYVSQQDGTILAAEVQAVTDAQGEITGYEVVGEVEFINLIKNIPNHNDDGALNTNINNRQVTGLSVEQDTNGNIILYVTSSDPRIGGGSSGTEQDLDTNSSIISRLTLTNPTAPLGDSRWSKVDLVIGLPRSEENHSINGLDIRTELVNGEPHQIMYVASGGNTNRGAPSNNFAWTSEYYYSTAVLRVDLTQLEQIEGSQGLQGGTSYVAPYVYALPTLNDPTRTDNPQGQDTATGTTGADDAEAGDTFGGNDGRNQAKYAPSEPVQIYSLGYRNHYDVVNTEAGNLYTFDNGPNNGWGDIPLTAAGEPVTDASQIGTNNPNINVDTGNDSDKDNLHLVTNGFYAGHPSPINASGEAAGLYSVDVSSGLPVVTQLTETDNSNNNPTTTADDLPSDWNSITGGITLPGADLYLSPGDNPDGSNPGTDNSLVTNGSSSNGLTEYTGSGVSDNLDAEILAVVSFNGDTTFFEIESDGTQNGTSVADTESVAVGGTPLDLTAVDSNGVNGSGLFENTVWIAQFGADAIAVLTPGAPPPPDNDQDDDEINDNIDPLQYDPANGSSIMLEGGDVLFWDFNPSDSGQNPGKGTPAEGPFNIGMTGWMINGTGSLEELTDLDNTIRGGAPGIFQVKSVESGTLLGTENTQQDALQTGFLPTSNVGEFTITVPIFNPFSSDANNLVNWSESASMGFTLGDGSMSNFFQIAVGASNPSDLPLAPSVQVTYEENDTILENLEIDAEELLNAIDDDQIELLLNVDLATYQVTPSWRYQVNSVWTPIETIGNSPIQLDLNGKIVSVLQGKSFINGVQSGPVVSMTSTSNGSEPFTADFLDLTIDSTASPPGTVETLYRINVGGQQVGSKDGSIPWSADTNSNPSAFRVGSGGDNIFTTSSAIDLSDPSITASATEAIFQSERFDLAVSPNMQWEFDVEPDGEYQVNLYFAEIFDGIDTVGERVFDVAVEGVTPFLFNNIDQFENAGQNKGFVLSQTTTVTDGSLSLEFLNNIENSALKAIEILSIDDVPELPVLSIDDQIVNEALGTALFTVSLSEASTSTVTVDFATADDTATASNDYVANSGTLTFDPGETTQTITVNILDDSQTEPDETFSVDLFDASGANIEDPTGIGTIVDNDAPTQPEVLYRINVGGGQAAATDGVLAWSADTNSNPSSFRVGSGGDNIFTTTAPIDISGLDTPASAPEAVFQSERFNLAASPNMQWEFDVEPDGEYQVNLYFAEIFDGIDTAGERVFGVAVEGTVPLVFDDIDQFEVAGQNQGFVLSHTATVTDGSLNLEFLNNIENPAIKGIEILAAN